jgi:hypothetical protein
MSGRAAFISVDDYIDHFKTLGKTSFNIYNGFAKRDADLFSSSRHLDSVDEAAEEIRNLLNRITRNGAQVTVYLPNKPGATAKAEGYPLTHYLDIPGPNNPGRQNSHMGSSSGYNNSGYQMGFSDALEKEKQLWEMRQEIKDIKRDQENETNVVSSLLKSLVKDLKMSDLASLISLLKPGTPAATVNGPVHQYDEVKLDEQEDERLHAAVTRLSKHFPDFVTNMESIADAVDEKPELAKMLLNFIK